MKRILVPVDFSEYSNNALRFATYFAEAKGMSLKLLHVIEEPGVKNKFFDKLPFIKRNTETPPVTDQDMELSTEEHLKRLVSLESLSNVKVEHEVRRTKVGVVKEILSEEDCDVIIMGRRRPENEDAFGAGAVAEKVIRLSAIPVITVADAPAAYSISNIVFAADFEEPEIKPIVERVLTLAQIFSARIHFLTVEKNRDFLSIDTTREKLARLTQQFDLRNHTVEAEVAATEQEGISEYINETGADLLVMCTHGRSGLLHYITGSIAEDMEAYTNIPILTYNISKKKIDRASTPVTREKVVSFQRNRERENLK